MEANRKVAKKARWHVVFHMKMEEKVSWKWNYLEGETVGFSSSCTGCMRGSKFRLLFPYSL